MLLNSLVFLFYFQVAFEVAEVGVVVAEDLEVVAAEDLEVVDEGEVLEEEEVVVDVDLEVGINFVSISVVKLSLVCSLCFIMVTLFSFLF